jgi:hypothetical protein
MPFHSRREPVRVALIILGQHDDLPDVCFQHSAGLARAGGDKTWVNQGRDEFMNRAKRFLVAASFIFMSGMLSSAYAQTNTIVYKLDGQQVARGTADAAAETQYVNYFGSVGGPGSKGFKLKSFAQTLIYDTTGFVVGGQWTLVGTREGINTTLSGPIAVGAQLQLKADGSIASGTYVINWLSGDPNWAVSGVFTMAVDTNSRPPKISGPLSLTFPVVQ